MGQFDRIVRQGTRCDLLFFCLFTGETIALMFYFPWLYQSALMALGLAVWVFTLFAYFVIRQYIASQCSWKLEEVLKRFVTTAEKLFAKDAMQVSGACVKFFESLQGKERRYVTPPRWLFFLSERLERFSCWLYWDVVHSMQEALLRCAVEQHLSEVRRTPTSLEAHTNLATAYVRLAAHYDDPRRTLGEEGERWIPPRKYTEEMRLKFTKTTQKAMEEFRIIKEESPEDPWVHRQLAYMYEDLQMPGAEMEEYEALLTLSPHDEEALFRLGTLYFYEGKNAKGLQVYAALREQNPQKAEEMIWYYGNETDTSLV